MVILSAFEMNPIPEASDKDLIERLSKTNIISDFVVNGDRGYHRHGKPTYERVRLASSDIITRAFKADSPLNDYWRRQWSSTMRWAFTGAMKITGVHAIDNTMFNITKAYLETSAADYDTTVLPHLDRLESICRDYFTEVTGMKVTLQPTDDPDTQYNLDKYGPRINGEPHFLVDLHMHIDAVKLNAERVARGYRMQISLGVTANSQAALITQLQAVIQLQSRRGFIVKQMRELEDYMD